MKLKLWEDTLQQLQRDNSGISNRRGVRFSSTFIATVIASEPAEETGGVQKQLENGELYAD